jgi:hypothetical protein
MIGSVELLILVVFSLFYLAIPLVTLFMVIKINQRLRNLEDLSNSRQ